MIGHLCRTAGLSVEQVDADLQRSSGLLALAGVVDFREVSRRADAGDPRAQLAIEVTVHRLVACLGGYAALMGGLDAIAFTAGIGEHAAGLRAWVLGALGLFGIEVDAAANETGDGERRITTDTSRVAAYVVPAGEEWEIARQCLDVLMEGAP